MLEMLLLGITIGPLLVAVVIWQLERKNHLKTSTNEVVKDKVVLSLAVPRNNDKSPLAAEQLFSSLHGIGLNKPKAIDHFSMEIAAGSYGIFFIVVVNKQYRTFFENQIYAQYPEAQIGIVNDYCDALDKSPGVVQVAELTLSKESYLPLRTFQSFDVDPLAGITGAISKLPPGQEIFVQLVTRPVNDDWQKAGKEHLAKLKAKAGDKDGAAATANDTSDKDTIRLIESKNSKVGFQFVIRIMAKSQDAMTSLRLIQETTAAYSQYRTAVFNSLGTPKQPKGRFVQLKNSLRQLFLGKRLGEQIGQIDKFKQRYLDEFTSAIINTEEYASLYHLPNRSVETPNISWTRSKSLEYPLNIPTDPNARLLGTTDYRGMHIRFGIKPEDRLRHMYVIGKTGVGKSKFLEGLIISDIYSGAGVGYIDPHGDSIDYILDRIPPHRKEDVVIFDPGDTEFPVSFNLLETKEGEDKSLIADGIVTVFKKQYGDSWGPRLEYILTNAILTLLHCQNVSLLVLPRLLSDDNYRKFLLKQLRDPILLKFWISEYEPLAKDARRRDAEIASILNKVGRFTTNPMIRNIIGQVKSSMDIKKIMDEGKILLVNLSQGKVGEENMALLGGMIITRMYSSVTQRVKQEERRAFYLYVDEFQNFSTSTFEKILSEARKYGLGLTVAHQFIDQIEEGIRNAIFGNVGTVVNFAVGPKDAEFLVKQYSPYLEPEDLVNLGKQKIVTKLSIDQAQSKPFTAITLTHNFPKTGLNQEIMDLSRKRYAGYKEQVEQRLYKWAEQTYNKSGNLMTKEELDLLAAKKPAPKQEDKPNPDKPKPAQSFNNRPKPNFSRRPAQQKPAQQKSPEQKPKQQNIQPESLPPAN